MPRIAITVAFTVKPGCWDAFNTHIRTHAAKTLAEEPGCERFDVLQPINDDGTPDHSRILLVEVYRDMEAVAAHRANPRMPSVAAGSKDLLAGRELTISEIA